MHATRARLLRIKPLTREDIAAQKVSIHLPPRSVITPTPGSAQSDSALPMATTLLRPKETIASSAEGIAKGDTRFVRALGPLSQKPGNLRIEPGERGKSLFFKVPKEKRYELKRILREQ